ncbi:Uncharacterised protein [Helicobacter fennelliae]|uniref:Uncharacterized protein n=1 Tax=Helicobacter fennelliae MRY12-0050 TaxID=1325130 RepID=T1CMK8_9HELI|nr:hypothetical protein HFN_1543 [Helicobacter fennelliae MRY12-0050]STP07542.1 Uncharacterised protein [Helicobacter fennelliae]STP07604.1 Uncharacterised protein [Helicobacter fennelliae]
MKENKVVAPNTTKGQTKKTRASKKLEASDILAINCNG